MNEGIFIPGAPVFIATREQFEHGTVESIGPRSVTVCWEDGRLAVFRIDDARRRLRPGVRRQRAGESLEELIAEVARS